ncbi:hypothetical protein BpHYR1_014237 [Brachionus plicatilis]|uniref:Uncharacterized protein n=1 Tax=Brachionus plicatilis TaxID=10195 RepID=A0A3M7SBN6_BRAPC|nr:hypothetical protein BpHYR1_014237 [Brachionus plicatilis]
MAYLIQSVKKLDKFKNSLLKSKKAFLDYIGDFPILDTAILSVSLSEVLSDRVGGTIYLCF